MNTEPPADSPNPELKIRVKVSGVHAAMLEALTDKFSLNHRETVEQLILSAYKQLIKKPIEEGRKK